MNRADAPRFEQPALPHLEAPRESAATAAAPARRPRRPRLATVTPLPTPSLDVEAANLVSTLLAAGVQVDQHQARALAAAGVTGLPVFTWPAMRPVARERAQQLSSALAADVARRRAAAAHARTRGGAS